MNIWKILAGIAAGCGLIAYFIGWYALLAKQTLWSIPTEFWFYDAIAGAAFGIFFLIMVMHGTQIKS